MKWIDVNEDFPQEDFDVICCCNDDVFIACFRVDAQTSFPWFESYGKEIAVTHWMPLPDAPVTK